MQKNIFIIGVGAISAAIIIFLVAGLALPPKKGIGIVVKNPEITRFYFRGVVKTPKGKIESINFEGAKNLFKEGDKIPLKKSILSPEWEIDE